MTTKRLNITHSDWDPNGNTLEATIDLDFRNLVRNKNLFSTLKLNWVCAYARQQTSQYHPSVDIGYGVWWMVDCSHDNWQTEQHVGALQGNVYNRFRASTSSPRSSEIQVANFNLIDYCSANSLSRFRISLQQYHRTESGYEDSSMDNVPGWHRNDSNYPAYIYVDYDLRPPTISNLVITNGSKVVDEPTLVSWTSSYQNKAKIIVNGNVVSTITTDTKFTIPKERLIIGENTVTVEVLNEVSDSLLGTTQKNSSATQKITLNTLSPTVSNINVINEGWLIDNPTRITWQSTNQSAYKIYADDILVLSGQRATDVSVNPGKFKVGTNIIRIEIIKDGIPGISDSARLVTNVSNKTFSRILPTLKTITMSGFNRDYTQQVTCESTNATRFIFQIGDVIKESLSGTVQFQHGTLPLGQQVLTVKAIRLTTFDETSVQLTQNVTIIEDLPLIYSLEPSSINVNVDNPNNVTFVTNEFCDSFTLNINGVVYYNGTEERIIRVPQNRFCQGLNEIKLYTYYRPKYEGTTSQKTSTRISTFNGYGKPQTPVLDSISVYNTATPVFTWKGKNDENNEQKAFEITILDASKVVESKIVNSGERTYTTTTPLENNKHYEVKVAIKNKYNIWSDFSAKRFTTSFNELPIPALQLNDRGYYVEVSCETYQVPTFSDIRVYKREEFGEWVCMGKNLNAIDSINDYTVRSNVPTQYKARVYDNIGGFSECEAKQIKVSFTGYYLHNILDEKNSFIFQDVEVNLQNNKRNVMKVFSGNSKPNVFYDNTKYITGELEIKIIRDNIFEIEDFIQDGKIFCYKDWRGRKIYCVLSINDVKYLRGFNGYCLTISLTEVNFLEDEMYNKKGYRRIVYLDGSYRLDARLNLDALTPTIQRSVVYNV